MVDYETVKAETDYIFLLRWQMEEEQANEIIAAGGSPSANRLAGTITVSKGTLAVTADFGGNWILQ